MTLTTTVQILPRTLLDLSLRAAELPVGLAARVAGQQNNSQWPPTVALGGFEATLETTIGGWLHDQVLIDKGLLRSEKLRHLRRAARLEAFAQQKRSAAAAKFEQQTDTADQARETARRQAARDQEAAAQQEAAAERETQQEAAEQKAAAVKAQERRAKAINRQERARTLAALDAEAQALQTTSEALHAQNNADGLGEKIEQSKAQRKGSTP